jgi:peptidoglycan/xylan/chitin deacetylase (PgdA/CDA1 family)
LTFDDGYASLAEHAYPILADLGFTATTFLITDYVGKTNAWDVRYTWNRLPHLAWPTIERWRARGFDFGSHGATHRRLTWLSDAEVSAELSRSRETLTSRLGPESGRAVAYPFGAADGRIADFAGASGYELGFGGVGAGVGNNGNRLQLPRVPVYMWDVGDVPLGLRQDAIGSAGKVAAYLANRCAVGTSIMLRQRSVRPPESAVDA